MERRGNVSVSVELLYDKPIELCLYRYDTVVICRGACSGRGKAIELEHLISLRCIHDCRGWTEEVE